jgi:hypothetical protein
MSDKIPAIVSWVPPSLPIQSAFVNLNDVSDNHE